MSYPQISIPVHLIVCLFSPTRACWGGGGRYQNNIFSQLVLLHRWTLPLSLTMYQLMCMSVNTPVSVVHNNGTFCLHLFVSVFCRMHIQLKYLYNLWYLYVLFKTNNYDCSHVRHDSSLDYNSYVDKFGTYIEISLGWHVDSFVFWG